LTNNKSLLPTSVSHLFQTLSSPHLHELHLSTCSLGPPACRDIASYLSSTRSRNLEHLELNGNCLGAEGIRDIVDAIESSNFTLKLAGFLANDPRPVMSVNEDGEKVEVERSAEERQAEERALAYQVHHRLPPLLERNRVLTRRVRSAARRIIAPARILLNAQPASPQTTAHRLMSSDLEPIFRLLDLPQEILFHIVRHCSGDPGALSESQFARFRAEAEDRGSLARSRGVKEGERMGMDQEERERAEVERREEWLRRGRWERWELDRLVEEQKLGTKG